MKADEVVVEKQAEIQIKVKAEAKAAQSGQSNFSRPDASWCDSDNQNNKFKRSYKRMIFYAESQFLY